MDALFPMLPAAGEIYLNPDLKPNEAAGSVLWVI